LGAIHLLSPSRKITLVHAVQQPLTAPQCSNFTLQKYPNATKVYIGGTWEIHGNSTAKLDLLASWTEPGDGSGGNTAARQFNVHVLEVPINLNPPPPTISDPVPVAIYTSDPESQHYPTVDRVQFLSPASETEAQKLTYLSRQEFGDTRHRRVTYRLVAASRFREYFPLTITNDAMTLSSVPITLDVNSSVPPAGLKVSYVIPVFDWSTIGPAVTRRRGGGGLRVYLGPTWYSSGDGEQLAVIISDVSEGSAEWGRDPINMRGGSTAGRVVMKGADGRAINPTRVGSTVFVPYDVQFEGSRRLWYADIFFDAKDTYFPFVKFGLARYQSCSLSGMEFSPTVWVNITQLAPDRFVTLSNSIAPDKQTIAIQVSERSPHGQGAIPTTIEVAVERRTLPGSIDELGWETADAPLQPVATAVVIAPDFSPLWTGQVTFPVPRLTGEFRLVVKEFELYASGAGSPAQVKRLVFSDTIQI
jgi:hypothetical protein